MARGQPGRFEGKCAMKTERVISVHVPKAAGTSLATQLVALLGEDVFLDYGHRPFMPTGWEKAEFPVGKRVVHGHFRASRYAAVEAYWMTFLREPVSNLLSVYNYWQSVPEHGNPVHSRFLRERPSITDFAKFPGRANLMSEIYFGAFDIGRFDFIGFHETRQDDLPRVGRELGLPLDANVHENRTVKTGLGNHDRPDPRVLAQVRDLLAPDVAFYETLRSLRG